LYPQAHHLNNAFQNTSIRAAGFDLIIGNPPFGQQSLYDPDFPELKKFSIHNYFLAKSMRLLREGGIAAFVVSRYFMDAADSSAREYIADQADFLGAVRLPETAFRQNALTDVRRRILSFSRSTTAKTSAAETGSPRQKSRLTTSSRASGGLLSSTASLPHTRSRSSGDWSTPVGMFADALKLRRRQSRYGFGTGDRVPPCDPAAAQFRPREQQQEKAPASQTLNREFIASAYFQALKMGAFCLEPRSRKIVFKTSGNFWRRRL
jgi:hypothetical protein